jgi:myo-inositol-1(or 4)-monophosphatase
MDASARVDVARAAARAGARVAAEQFRTDLTVETKANETDLVTRADRAAERAVVTVIRETAPREPIVGEEGTAAERGPALDAVPESGPAWIVDPIDGTNNYVRGIRNWATSVAAVVDGEPVAAVNVCPALGDTYVAGPDGARRDGEPISVSDRSDPATFAVAPTIWWDGDHREEYAAAAREIVDRFGDLARFRCAQLTLSLVAAGGLEGAITNVTVNPWDSVAGVHLVEAAGGRVTDLDGDRWTVGARGLVASNGRRHDEVLAAARAITEGGGSVCRPAHGSGTEKRTE